MKLMSNTVILDAPSTELLTLCGNSPTLCIIVWLKNQLRLHNVHICLTNNSLNTLTYLLARLESFILYTLLQITPVTLFFVYKNTLFFLPSKYRLSFIVKCPSFFTYMPSFYALCKIKLNRHRFTYIAYKTYLIHTRGHTIASFAHGYSPILPLTKWFIRVSTSCFQLYNE